MHLAPVPLFFCPDPEQAIKTAALSSRTTHGALTHIDACRCLAALLVGTLQGRTKHEILIDDGDI
jgi:ADP-ribosyl-[dinitrogen reductase] hydrolase